MRYDGKDVTITIGGVAVPLLSVEYSDTAPTMPVDRTPGVYAVTESYNGGRWWALKGPLYPGEGNRLARRTAAKGKVRR